MPGRDERHVPGLNFAVSPAVEWHFRTIFTKLGLTSRRDLATALRTG
ncbi:hypothetical protein [Actinoplanes missouriensis]|nr:hypothetical protein [Actinoplanes missouriensis]